jgi:hypothetical protein
MNPRNRLIHKLICGLALSFAFVAPAAIAQQPSVRPDALILIQPAGEHAILTVSYSGKVPHAQAKQALASLAKLGKWKMSTPEISDVEMKSSPQFGPVESLGTQTGATVTISGAPLAQNGGFILQPFVEAFHGLRSFKLLYWVAAQPGFQGLRRFESPELSIELIQEGNPYRYSITNHTRQGALPKLPLTQAPPSNIASVEETRPARQSSPWAAVMPVLCISVVSGLVVFAALRFFSLARNRGRNRTHAGRTSSQDSRHTSRI